jgi:hypothetical protein
MEREMRNYKIEYKNGGWQIYLNGKHVCQQPSEQFARKWVALERCREQREAMLDDRAREQQEWTVR